MIRSSAERVCPIFYSREVLQFNVIICQFRDIPGHAPVYFLRVPVVLQIGVVHIDYDLVGASYQ